MTVYGKRIVEALDRPCTLQELAERTGFPLRFVLRGVWDARADGRRVVAVAVRGLPTTFELRAP